MARRIVTEYVDDVTGESGEGIRTHTLVLDGVEYEVDLGRDSYQALLDCLGPYFRAARKTASPSRGQSKRALSAGYGPDSVLVRQWARKRGFDVSARGPVPSSLIQQYKEELALDFT